MTEEVNFNLDVGKEAMQEVIIRLEAILSKIRAGKANLKDGFCLIRKGEMRLHNVHISPLTNVGSFFNHDPLRIRKLLAHRKEIFKLDKQLSKKGTARNASK